MNRSPTPAAPPLSRPLDIATVGDAGLRQRVLASEAEREALAALDGLVAIESLTGDLKVRREGRFGLHVTGTVEARIRQTCVVTLEDFDTDVVEPVDLHFLTEAEIAAEAARRAKVQPIAGGEEPFDDLPDPIVHGRIDLGAITAEFLALGLDPYPKKPGTSFVEQSLGHDIKLSPFAALGRLKSSEP